MRTPTHYRAPHLVETLDAFRHVIDERDECRSRNAEARAWLADEPCTCREVTNSRDGEVEVDPCCRCIALSILRGPS